MADVVAVHGAFRGGWSWDLVRPLLERDGHRWFSPDLTGMGTGPQPAVGDVTLDDWIADVVEVVESNDLAQVVLVGHSMGGVVAQAALGVLGSRVARLVVIDAPLIAEGQRAIDVSGPTPPPAGLLPPRSTWLAPTPVGAVQGFEAPLAAWVNERLCATPFGPQLDPCPAGPRVVPPMTIAFCSRTPQGYPSTFARARCDGDATPYLLLDSHHDAPLVASAATASCIMQP